MSVERIAAMPRVTLFAALLAGLVAGCTQVTLSEAPHDFSAQVAALPPTPADSARIVIGRDDLHRGAYGVAQVTINDLPPANLANGGLIARDVPPGINAISVESGALNPVQANVYTVTVIAGGTAWVRMVLCLTQGETSVVGDVSQTPQGGSGSILPDMSTAVGNFQIEEMPRELRGAAVPTPPEESA